ncbi:hypothetical protein [Actinoplanes regularis]|uniref:Leucine rich repeat variant n=1 Tax=Actinoplanes regularis TaxID=52697 RepID=A0A239C473_9ACTN|nr:hypothetical protein [Actinoplanes regularis]GIE88143.1 hypothetical protein Are01nite_46230 [Actinoplanes regularis]SNS14478.1 hypothetical protein SAMN06264365_110272 [Actinoplanes regularis]
MQRDLVLKGLAENPAVPVDVLTRLLCDWPHPVVAGLRARADLPVTLQEQMAGHESRQVRSAVASHEPLDPGIRETLLSDPDWHVRTWAFASREHPLPEEALIRVMTDLLDLPDDMPFLDHELFEEMFFADRNRILVVARHPDPRVRRFAVPYAGRNRLRFLVTDPDPQVAAAAAASVAEHERLMQPADLPKQHCHAFWWVLQRPLSQALAEQVAASGDVEAIQSITVNPTLPPNLVEILARHPDPEVRDGIAARADLDADQVAAFVADPDPAVRAVVAGRAGLTREQIAALAADPDDAVRTTIATYAYLSEEERAILDGNADLAPDRAPQWARSKNPRLRRRAAQCPDLPPELTDLLTTDPDATVRTNLALNHPGAPSELLLSCFLDDRHRTELLARPQFPRTGLSRFADHDDPRVRLLVARDPDPDPMVIGRLTADPDRRVREAMARSPHLPADRLTALLDDAELAADAAANPSLDWEPVIEALRQTAPHGTVTQDAGRRDDQGEWT